MRLLCEGAGLAGHIDFSQNDHRGHTSLMGHSNIAFQPRQAEVIIARGHNKSRVEICSDELFFAIMARCPPFDQAFTAQQLTVARCVCVKEEPVPNGDAMQAGNDRVEINALDTQRVAMDLCDTHRRGLGEGG